MLRKRTLGNIVAGWMADTLSAIFPPLYEEEDVSLTDLTKKNTELTKVDLPPVKCSVTPPEVAESKPAPPVPITAPVATPPALPAPATAPAKPSVHGSKFLVQRGKVTDDPSGLAHVFPENFELFIPTTLYQTVNFLRRAQAVIKVNTKHLGGLSYAVTAAPVNDKVRQLAKETSGLDVAAVLLIYHDKILYRIEGSKTSNEDSMALVVESCTYDVSTLVSITNYNYAGTSVTFY